MDWEKLKIFRYVAQEQSFTHAGIKLNLSQSAASRQIKKLEEEIGIMLFHRHARGLLLTEQGETLLKYANEVFEKISSAENSLIINKEHFKTVKKNICIMHCVTDYPVSKDQANLKCIDNIKNDFNLITGYSDHTLGILATTIAVTKGATVIEKHLTLNKKMQGPDHLASLEPKEFLKMVENIREFELMNGNGKKKLQECEIRNLKVARKSIIAKIAINKNEIFTFKNLTVKRPGTGLNPFMIEKLINKKSKKKYYADQIIEKQ